jgi:hypothetical protein
MLRFSLSDAENGSDARKTLRTKCGGSGHSAGSAGRRMGLVHCSRVWSQPCEKHFILTYNIRLRQFLYIFLNGCIISQIFVISVIQNFALIFSEKFKDYGITTTDLTLILNINSAVCNGLGRLSPLRAECNLE